MPKPDPVLAAFGRDLRNRREARQRAQEGFAERADVDRTYISGIERGLRNPGIKNALRLARALGIPSLTLMEMEGLGK
jgi:transcriptional regulator with XRE-family HTH domain